MGVTADRLCEIYYNLNKKYFGDDLDNRQRNRT